MSRMLIQIFLCFLAGSAFAAEPATPALQTLYDALTTGAYIVAGVAVPVTGYRLIKRALAVAARG